MKSRSTWSLSSALERIKALFRRETSIRTIVYGVQSTLLDESQLVWNLNQFLKRHEAGKIKKEKTLESYSPEDGSVIAPRVDYFYWASSGKAHPGWFFNLEPNVGLNGRAKFEDAADCAWLLYAGQNDSFNKTPGYHEIIKGYIASLLEHAAFPTRVLRTIRPGES